MTDFVGKFKAVILVVINNFGPLLIFYPANHFFGLKVAIAASLAFTACDITFKIVTHQRVGSLLIFSTIMTLIFGAVDLYSANPFMIKYESCVTNLVTAIFFAGSLFSEKTVIQEFYEKRQGAKPLTPDRLAYMRILTGIWVLYFLAKTAAYFLLAQRYDLEQAMLVRAIVGTGSLYLMLALSIFGSKYLFAFLKRRDLLPAAENRPSEGR